MIKIKIVILYCMKSYIRFKMLNFLKQIIDQTKQIAISNDFIFPQFAFEICTIIFKIKVLYSINQSDWLRKQLRNIKLNNTLRLYCTNRKLHTNDFTSYYNYNNEANVHSSIIYYLRSLFFSKHQLFLKLKHSIVLQLIKNVSICSKRMLRP